MESAAIIAGAVLLGLVIPVVGMRMLVPSLEAGRRVPNFRGRPVFAGLGTVWLLWAGSAILGAAGGAYLRSASLLGVLGLAGPLALVAFALGLVDDAYGTGADRGFRGHLRAAAKGRLTTGGMKLLGISLASYVVAVVIESARAQGEGIGALVLALPAGAAIALTANLVNLTDLRPGRALKAYGLLAVVGLVSVAGGLASQVGPSGSALGVDVAALAIFLVGPLLATWQYDLGERGMMGDAGANAAGAVAGLLIVAGLPPVGIGIYLVVMLGLNLASERYSFSRLIEGSALLKRIDMLGRERFDSGEPRSGETE